MSSDLNTRILELLGNSGSLKASEIAARLGVTRAVVNGALYGSLRGKVSKLPGHRWTVAECAQSSGLQEAATPNSFAGLFRYYLDCLASDGGVGVSVFAESRYDLDYALLPSMPLDESDLDWTAAEGVDRLLARQRRETKTKMLWLGWPLAWRKAHSRTGWSGAFVEPVLMWPFDVEAETPSFINEPVLNMKLLERLAGDANPLEEAAELSEILGIDAAEDLDCADVGAQLAAVRPDWPWAQEPDPDTISENSPDLDERPIGIFNRAAVVLADREPFTVGLETELRNLQTVADDAIEQSALGVMLANEPCPAGTFDHPILEAAPLNAEQRDAIRSALSAPLTVITGPPGTGKSQVVTAIIVNAAYYGLKVLFASKNNKAVDVVEERVNGLATRPVLMRLGGHRPREGTADQLASILSVRTDSSERAAADKATQEVARIAAALADLDSRIERLRVVRNETDAGEQRAEIVRQQLGEDIFTRLIGFDIEEATQIVAQIKEAASGADRTCQRLFLRLFWPLFRKDRRERFVSAAEGANILAGSIGIESCPDDPAAVPRWVETLQTRLDAAKIGYDYHALRAELVALGDPAALTRERLDRLGELSAASHAAWEGWLASIGERLSATERKALGDYVALLRTIANSQEGGGQISREVWSRYYRLAAQVAKVMPGWAVTSLSAKGRVPFESGLFDLVVIDEASQCDIASVLPLLFRARRAVIIGDPQQLRHISRLTADKDQAFMVRHGILDDPGAGWSYRAVSLYELAQSRVPVESVITLRDHHRSHEAIIRFSNQQFYAGALRVATDYSLLQRHGQPALRWLDIKGKVVRPPDGGAVNEKEAIAVVEELRRLAVEQRYPGSIGVVTPFRAQARRVRDLVSRDDMLSTILAAREFLSDTAHKFQGDERDLMIFSPVVSSGVPDSALGFLRKSGHLFNVAITRGRASVVTIGDKAACAQSDVAYLEQFVAYCDSWENAIGIEQKGQVREPSLSPIYPSVGRPELVSDWEHVFYELLIRAGIASVPQYEFDQYILDFAIFSNGARKLDVEIDGERYHRALNGEHLRRDQLRDMRLMEMGWDVRRFWVYQVRDEPDLCIDVIRKWIDQSHSTH